MDIRIALLGYGKMGKSIERILLEKKYTISAKIDHNNPGEIEQISLQNTDVVIEFTEPLSVLNNIKTIVNKKVPIVVGTTGWLDSLSEIKTLVERNNSALIFGSNFSIGVNILFQTNQFLAKLMNKFPEYDAFVEERHHRYKKDAPSGTALSLANQLINELSHKTKIADTQLKNRAPEDAELSVGFIRSGEIFGTHKVGFQNAIDKIELSHQAFSRLGFAKGAVLAAEWVANKKGVYDFNQEFYNILSEK